jgi:mandelate racemase
MLTNMTRASSADVALTVTGVTVRALELVPERPVETAAGTLATVPLVLVDLATHEGVVGRSYLRCYTPLALRATARLVEDVAETLTGCALAPDGLNAALRSRFRLLGVPGLIGIAIAGLEMAAWDAHAKARGLPLVELLGGRPRPIPAYASLRSMRPDAAAQDAAAAVAEGFHGVKLKLGTGSLADDLEAIRAVRAAIGPRSELMVDYNQSLSVDEALRRVPALDAEGLAWIEEPTRADDYAGHARIAALARTPIQLGENWWGREDMEKSLAAGASDQVTLDVMKLGGVRGWLRAAALAADAGLPASSHSFPELSVHLLALTPTCRRLEYLDHAGPILAEPVRIVDGLAQPPTQPGSGLEWDEEQVRRWLVG